MVEKRRRVSLRHRYRQTETPWHGAARSISKLKTKGKENCGDYDRQKERETCVSCLARLAQSQKLVCGRPADRVALFIRSPPT